MGVLPVYTLVYYTRLVPMTPEEGIRSAGPGINDDGDLPCGCFKLNLGTPKKQPVSPVHVLRILFEETHLETCA